jgi:hypothetical protein
MSRFSRRMSEIRRLTTLCASKVCYRDRFIYGERSHFEGWAEKCLCFESSEAVFTSVCLLALYASPQHSTYLNKHGVTAKRLPREVTVIWKLRRFYFQELRPFGTPLLDKTVFILLISRESSHQTSCAEMCSMQLTEFRPPSAVHVSIWNNFRCVWFWIFQK